MFIKGWNQEIQLVLIAVAAVVVLGLIIRQVGKARSRRQRQIVSESSKRLAELRDLNQKSYFHDLSESYPMVQHVNSKAQFDRTSPRDVMLLYLREDREKWEDILRRLDSNKRRYEEYLRSVEELPAFVESKEEIAGLKVPLQKYQKYEKELFESDILKPVCEGSFICMVKYDSPKGRNSYRDPGFFREADMRLAMEEIDALEKAKETAQYQRRIMTPQMRYRIMRRDQFRCVLCGRSAEDGVKLHVDHIKPPV